MQKTHFPSIVCLPHLSSIDLFSPTPHTSLTLPLHYYKSKDQTKSFHTSQTSMRQKILKAQTKSSLLSRISNKILTLGLSSFSPKLKCTNEDHGVKN